MYFTHGEESMDYKDIPQFPMSRYRTDVDLRYLEDSLNRYREKFDLDMDPDFQRGHVWTPEQQTSYMEYMLRGGEGGREILFNHPNWMGSFHGKMVIIDGKQRITAALGFLRDEVPVFGKLCSEIEGRMPNSVGFSFRIFSLKTREDILRYYLDLNAGGTPHAAEEIERVRALLKDARLMGAKTQGE